MTYLNATHRLSFGGGRCAFSFDEGIGPAVGGEDGDEIGELGRLQREELVAGLRRL